LIALAWPGYWMLDTGYWVSSKKNSIYFNIDNLVLWARSDITGSAIIKCLGVLENWNVGILGIAERDLLLERGHSSKITIRTLSAFHTQHSIAPPFQYSIGYHLLINITSLG
jgi:hypothetical protein